jgi:hypothetical protein
MKKLISQVIMFVVFIIYLVLSWVTHSKAIVLDFQDNLPAPPGFYGAIYFNNYTANKSTDQTGKKVFDLDLSYNVGTLNPTYFSKLWNRTFAISVAIPFGKIRSRNFLGEKENSNGLGDIVITPGVFLYDNNETTTYISFWENISFPTGDWSEKRALRGGPNLGANYWYLQHQIAFAQLLDKGKYSIDLNLFYYEKFKEPKLDVRFGDSFEVEAIVGYGFTSSFRGGIYIDYLADIKDTKITGAKIDNSKRKFFSMGPSLAYGTEKWAIHFRFVPDIISENGPKGFQSWLRLTYNF